MNKLKLIRKSDKPIGTYNSEKDIRIQLKEICDIVKAPLDNVSEKERVRIVDFVTFYYPKFCAKELALAFEYAVSGLFEADTEHYGQLSYKYIAGVLNKYRVYVSNIKINNNPTEEQSDISEEEKHRICIESTYLVFEQYKNNRDKVIFSVFYDFLEAEGVKILLEGNTLENYKKLAGAKLATERNKQGSNKQKPQIDNGNIFKDKFNPSVEHEAKSLAVKYYFDYLIENQKELEL